MTTVAIISLVVAAAGLGFTRGSTSPDGATAGMMVATLGIVCLILSGLALVFG